MDIFDVLNEIVKKKINLIRKGMSEKYASKRSVISISNDYHIPLADIRKIYNYV